MFRTPLFVAAVSLSMGMPVLSQAAEAPAPAISGTSEEAKYEACLKLAQEKPVEAYQEALNWAAQGTNPAAQHCVASALLGLGDYARAAERLEDLGYAPEWISNSVRVGIFQQSGDAFLQANEPERAVRAYGGGLKYSPGNPYLLLGQARAWVMLEKDKSAIEALDGALKAQPENVSARILRADALIRTGKLTQAGADVDAALKQAPQSVDVLLLRGRYREAVRMATTPKK